MAETIESEDVPINVYDRIYFSLGFLKCSSNAFFEERSLFFSNFAVNFHISSIPALKRISHNNQTNKICIIKFLSDPQDMQSIEIL